MIIYLSRLHLPAAYNTHRDVCTYWLYMYSWDNGIHGIFVNPTKNNAATRIIYKCSANKNLF